MDYKGVNYTLSEDPIADNIVGAGKLDAKEIVHTEVYEASAVAQDKTIALFKDLPDGFIVTDLIVVADALGANTSIKVGDSDTADRYIGSSATTSAGRKQLDKADGLLYELGTNDGDNTILLTQGGTGSATGTIKAVIRGTMGK